MRAGVVRVLEETGFTVVGEAGDADELLAQVREHRPDVVVTDIRMPPTNTDEGVRAAAAIRAELPDTGVLVLSQYVSQDYARPVARRRRRRRRLPAQAARHGAAELRRSGQAGRARRLGARPGGRGAHPRAPAPRRPDRQRSPSASGRCSRGWRKARPIARSRPSSSSATPRWSGPGARSSRSSSCRPTSKATGGCSPS